jgi:hypothetical protein
MSAEVLNADGSVLKYLPDIKNSVASFCKGNSALPSQTTGSVTINAGTTELSESINGLTGTSSGLLSDMMQTPSIIADNYNLSYGFFDAAAEAVLGLTDQDQIYAYLTPPQQNWMGDLVLKNPEVKGVPFSTFALPGAHDSGTFDLTAVKNLLDDVEFVALLAGYYGEELIDVLSSVALNVVTGEAVTQKDDIPTMLNLGCRYFDFRPGMMPSPLNVILPDIYHIHAVIPGHTFNSFLTDILTWLNGNPSEIVVVNLQTAGFLDVIAIPTVSQLQTALESAQIQTGTQFIQIGSAEDLQKTYGELVSKNKRLFFLNTSPEFTGWNPASKYDSYIGDNYCTNNPVKIINALEKMNTKGQLDNTYTVLQLQGTVTGQNIKFSEFEIIASLMVSTSNAYRPLLSTKALFDSKTYPWLLNNVSKNLSNNQLLVMLNDFVDNGLATVASSLTLERCNS